MAAAVGPTQTDPIILTADVADLAEPDIIPVGSVSWYDYHNSDGSTTMLNPLPVAVDSSGHATFTVPPDVLVEGPHSVLAAFTPADATLFKVSFSASVTFNSTPGGDSCHDPASLCWDPQYIRLTVEAGTLLISTPYTPTNPFALGHMALDPAGTYLHASAPFGTVASPDTGLAITDTRAGDLSWTASAYSVDFVSGPNQINGQNFGFDNVTVVPVAGNALATATKPVIANDVPSGWPGTIYGIADPGTHGLRGSASTQHTFASALHGAGSVGVVGTLALFAPTSTPAGTYTDVLTFTIA